MSLWSYLVNAEHAIERALGLHPPPDLTDVGSSASAPLAGPAILPRAGNATTAERIRELDANVQKFWTEVTGKPGPMPTAARHLFSAHAGLESTWGGGWKDKSTEGKGDMRGSHNYGARQCGAHDSGGASWDCREYGDTTPNADGTSTPIPAKFRYYKDGEGRSAAENGAYYFLRDLVKTWPVLAELEAGDVAAYAHRLGPDKANGGLYYYGGFGKNFAEREANYVKGLASRLPEVVAALGHDRVYAIVRAPDPPLAGASDGFDPVTWIEIDAPGGYRVWTNAEPLARGGVPVPMSFAQLLSAARSLNAIPLTRQLSDARWAAATDRRVVNPVPSKDGAHFNDPVQNAAFAAAYGPLGTVLRDGGHKEMVLEGQAPTRDLKSTGPGSMVFYGWRKPDGSTWQKGIKSDHDRDWIEYDSLGSIVRRDATKGGVPVDLLAEVAAGSPIGGPVAPHLVTELGGLSPLAGIDLGNIRVGGA